MTEEIRYLGDVQRLVLMEGDIVVISVDEYLSLEMSRRIKSAAQEIVADHKVMVLGKGMKIGVLSQKEAA